MHALVLGAYLAFVYVCTETQLSIIIIHGFLNFMGKPNYSELLDANFREEKS
jgi:hypothetical protein